MTLALNNDVNGSVTGKITSFDKNAGFIEFTRLDLTTFKQHPIILINLKHKISGNQPFLHFRQDIQIKIGTRAYNYDHRDPSHITKIKKFIV